MANTSDDFKQQTTRAIVLCLIVAFIYTNVFMKPKTQPTPPASQAPTSVQPQTAPVNVQPAAVAPQVVVPAQPQGIVAHPTSAEISAGGITIIESERARFEIAHLGARIKSLTLTGYKEKLHDEAPFDLVGNHEGVPLPLGVYVASESDERTSFRLVSVNGAAATSATPNLKLAPLSTVTLEYQGSLPSGVGVTKKITIRGDSYLFTVDVALSTPIATGQPAWIEWPRYMAAEHTGQTQLSHVTYLDGFNKIQHVPVKESHADLRDFGTTRWVALGDHYFMAALIPAVSGRNTLIAMSQDLYTARVAGTAQGGSFSFYAGPKEYNTLEKVGDYRLERAIDLGIFSFLALPLLWLLHTLHEWLNNYGLSIIALTLIVKTVLLPLSQVSFKSMEQMREIQPEINALRERVKDPNQLNQEIFALYKRRGVNPMGGCFPMLIQIPVFLGLYQALLNAIELRHAPFALWIDDLSSPEKLTLFGIGVPVMVLLMAASMIIQQWTSPTPSADPAQQKAMKFMPFIFAGMFIIFPMPAGLVLYWLVNNIISIIQQMYLRNSQKGSVYVGTLIASVAIFGVGYLLTLI